MAAKFLRDCRNSSGGGGGGGSYKYALIHWHETKDKLQCLPFHKYSV